MKANKNCKLKVTALGLAFMMSLTGCSNSKPDDKNILNEEAKPQIEQFIEVPNKTEVEVQEVDTLESVGLDFLKINFGNPISEEDQRKYSSYLDIPKLYEGSSPQIKKFFEQILSSNTGELIEAENYEYHILYNDDITICFNNVNVVVITKDDKDKVLVVSDDGLNYWFKFMYGNSNAFYIFDSTNENVIISSNVNGIDKYKDYQCDSKAVAVEAFKNFLKMVEKRPYHIPSALENKVLSEGESHLVNDGLASEGYSRDYYPNGNIKRDCTMQSESDCFVTTEFYYTEDGKTVGAIEAITDTEGALIQINKYVYEDGLLVKCITTIYNNGFVINSFERDYLDTEPLEMSDENAQIKL